MQPKFIGHIQDGKLTLANRNSFANYLLTLNGKVELTVKKYHRNRSNEQNRYWWGVVVKILADHLGYDSQEMHDALKWEFLRKDGPMPTVKGTSKLNTKEFCELIERVQRWVAMTFQVYIPDPNEVGFEIFQSATEE